MTRVQSQSINLISKLSQALWLKHTDRLKHQVSAQLILEEIVDGEIVKQDLTVTAMLNLFELLLEEFEKSDHIDVIAELEILSNKLLGVAKAHNLYPLLIETYILKAKLELMKSSPKSSQELLSQAYLLAQEKGLKSLAIEVSRQLDSLLDANSSSKPISVKESKKELSVIFKPNINDTNSIDREDPVNLILLNNTQKVIFSQTFIQTFDQDIFIENMSKDVFPRLSKQNPSEIITQLQKFEAYSVLLKSIGSLLICYVS